MADQTEADKAKGVDKTHPDYDKFSPKWRRVRDASAGQDAIYAGAVLYLPKLKGELPKDYTARQNRTTWFNATYRTFAGLLGMLFRKDPTVEAPAGIEAHLNDVTMTGIPFVNFCKEVAAEVIGPGWCGVMIDHPPRPQVGDAPLTVAMAEKLGLRPSMAIYKCEAILNWRFKRVNNAWVLSQVRLKECVKEENGDFGENEVDQIRVLDLTVNPDTGVNYYRQRLYRKNERQEWVQFGPEIVPLKNGAPLDFVPFLFVTPDGIVAELDEPPLIDLVDLNIKHFMVSADYEHGCHFTGLPTPWVTGMTPKIDPVTGREIPQTLSIGSQSAWVFQNHEAKVGYLEFTGQGLSELRENLTRKESQMAAIGARMLAPEKTGVEAAETLAIRNSGEQSVLASIAVAVSLAMTKALTWFADWAGSAGECKVDVNRDFLPVGMDPARLTALMGAWQAGGLSEQEFFDQLQRGDVIRAEKTFEEHQAEIEANPPMGVQAQQAAMDALNEPPDAKDDKKDKGGDN